MNNIKLESFPYYALYDLKEIVFSFKFAVVDKIMVSQRCLWETGAKLN